LEESRHGARRSATRGAPVSEVARHRAVGQNAGLEPRRRKVDTSGGPRVKPGFGSESMTVLILHGTWSPAGEEGESDRDGHFFAWAERVPAGRRGRRPAAGPRDGAPHPFQARPEETRDALVSLSPALMRQ